MPTTPPARRATQPQRRFTALDLAALERDGRRKLAQVLLTETENNVVEAHRPVAYDELVLEARPLWRPRRVRVRIADRAVTQDDVDRLPDAVDTGGDAEGPATPTSRCLVHWRDVVISFEATRRTLATTSTEEVPNS
jgi:hypothetical protein